MTALWHAAKVPGELDPPMDPAAQRLTDHYVREMRYGFDNDERALQSDIGSSEIGWECDRRIAYKLAGRPRLNFSDPLRAIIGTGFHLWQAQKFRWLNRIRGGRYAVEYACSYRDIPGHGDLYDYVTSTVTDWKTTKLATIREMQRRGVPSYYVVQVQHNATALWAEGLEPKQVSLVFFPIDSVLDRTWTWRGEPNKALVDAAIDRVDRLRGVDPAYVPAHTGRHCGYCSQYDPNSTDLSWSCPAKKGK